MKSTFVKTTAKKFITAAALIAVLTTGAINAKAGENKAAKSTVEYIGTVNDNVAFNVQYKNETGSTFNLSVVNEAGEVIYTSQFTGQNFSKKVVIENVPEDAHVTFILKGADATMKQSFDVSTATRTVADVRVSKAN
jgi:hypothetical protein